MKKTAKRPYRASEIVTYELAMPVFKSGTNLNDAFERMPEPTLHRAQRDALATAAGCWAEGAAILLRLHLHFSDRLAACEQQRIDMDCVWEADGNSITVSGPARSLRPIVRDRLLRDVLVKLEGGEERTP